MNLIVDVGNSRVKVALYEGGKFVAECSAATISEDLVSYLLAGRHPARAIVSSTRGDTSTIVALLRHFCPYVLSFNHKTPVPITNIYQTPETLGSDRLAAAVGAMTQYPDHNVLIVDFGTALTIDLVTADKTFCGGCISPGLSMRFRALHDYTAQLPLCSPDEEEALLGDTTKSAIQRGVMHSMTFEVEGYIARLQEKIDKLSVIFTGGDAKFFVKRIKNTIFADCNLVLCGLDRILEYNALEKKFD